MKLLLGPRRCRKKNIVRTSTACPGFNSLMYRVSFIQIKTVRTFWERQVRWFDSVLYRRLYDGKLEQDAQLSQRDRAAGCVIVFAKSRTLERGDNDLRIL